MKIRPIRFIRPRPILFLLSAFLVAGAAIILYSYFFSKPAAASWMDEKWLYRIPLTITHNAEVLNNKVKFDIDTATLITAGKMQSDCGDTRFTDASGKLLKYYLDSANGACNTNSTDYYVLIPKVLNGTTVLYHYYGNPSAPNGTEAAQLTEATLTPSGSYAAGSEAQGPGPVGYWKFDDGQGTTAQDSSSSNNDGTITGSTWQTEDRCVAGKCLYFDGTGDYVQVADSGSSDILDLTGAITIEAWIYKTDTNDRMILSKHNSTNDTGYLFAVYQSKLLLQFGNGTSWPYSGNLQGNATISANKWYHVTATRNGTQVYFYVNGVLDASPTVGSASIAVNNQNVWIGRDVNYGNDIGAFIGKIDDVKVYPYARTAAQVKTDYLAGKANASAHSGTGAALGSSPQDWLSNGLVGYWKMDEASWDTTAGQVLDASGNGNNGTSAGNATTAAGKFGNGGTFDGNGDYVNISSTPINAIPSSSYTVSTWFNVSSQTTSSSLFSFGQGTATDETDCYIHYPSGNISCNRIAGGVNISASDTTKSYVDGTWHHFVAVYDNSAKSYTVYTDGVQKATTSNTSFTAASVNQAWIGELYYGSPLYSMNGKIDDTRIYNRTLSPKEVSDLYHWAPGPVGYWDFEAGSGDSVVDKSGNANTGTWNGTGTKHWDTGKYGKAGKFDGTSDYVNVDSSTNWSFGAGDFAIDFWIKPDTSQNGPIMGRRWTNRSWMVYLQGTSLYLSASSDGTNWDIFSSTLTATVTNNVWQHVAYVRSGSNWYVYLNGVRVTSLTSSSTVYAGSEPLHIGADSEGATWYYSKGLLDEIKIYKYARSAKQVVSDMNANHPAVGSPVGSAVGHWKFDEGQGITANNSGGGGSGLNGTLTTMASPATATSGWTQAGRFGKGLAFDGGSDYVNLGDSKFLYDEVTVSFWTNNIGHASNTQYATYFIARESDDDGCGVYYDNDNDKIRAFCTIGGVAQNLAESNTTTDTGWHQITAIFSGSSGRKLYKDGVLVGSDATYTQSFDDLSSTNTYIGRGRTLAATEYVYGTIDEPKIYNYALTASEILTDYNRGSSLVLGALGSNSSYPSNSSNQEYCIPGDSSTCTAPIAEWKFEEAGTVGVGSTAYDTSGNNKSGAWAGTSTTHTVSGKFGKAGKFNGTDDFVDIPTNTVFNDVRTISAWFKITGGAGTDRLIVARDIAAGLGGGWGIAVAQNNQVRYHMNIGGTWRSFDGSTPALNTWYFVAATYDGTALRGYLNGVPDGSSAQTGALGTGTNPVRLGGDSTGGTNRTMVGSIDQVRIFDYARSAAQIAYDYNRGAPVGHWKFDECQGATAYDSSGNKNNGTITIGATDEATIGTCTTSSTAWGTGATGKRNASLSFDGSDDYISIADSSLWNFGSNDFSIGFWIKWNGTPSGIDSIIGQSDGGGSTAKWNLIWGMSTGYAYEGTTMRFHFVNPTTTGNFASFAWIPTGNTWYHLTLTRSGSSWKFYVNGVQTGGTQTQATALLNPGSTIQIGSDGESWNFFPGQIDDVKIFNYALTATQVKDIMNNGAVFFGPSTGSP